MLKVLLSMTDRRDEQNISYTSSFSIEKLLRGMLSSLPQVCAVIALYSSSISDINIELGWVDTDPVTYNKNFLSTMVNES